MSFTLYIHWLPLKPVNSSYNMLNFMNVWCKKLIRHISDLHASMPIIVQLPWILFCKVLKINSRLGTLNQRVIQMSQWCPTVASAMFSFLFSLLYSFKSQESFMLCAHVKARLIVCKSIYTFFSPWQTYSVQIEERIKNEKKAHLKVIKNVAQYNSFYGHGLCGLMSTFCH